MLCLLSSSSAPFPFGVPTSFRQSLEVIVVAIPALGPVILLQLVGTHKVVLGVHGAGERVAGRPAVEHEKDEKRE